MKVVVVGGGVVGLACAFELQRAGAEVVVLERGVVGGGTSLGNTGWVCPSFTYPLPGPGVVGDGLRSALHLSGPLAIKPSLDPAYLRWLWRFRARCTHSHWQAGVRALAALNARTVELLDDYPRAGVSFESYGTGLLLAARKPAKLAAYRELFAELAALGAASYRELDAGEAHETEPSLDAGLAGALLTSVDRWVRPETLTAGLATWLRERGAEVREQVEVRAVAGSRVDTDSGPLACDRVVVAAGITSTPLLGELGAHVTMAPARGYSVFYEDAAAPRPSRALYLADALLGLSRYDGGVRMVGVFELGHHVLSIDEKRLRAMLESADPFFARWRPSTALPAARWSGLRPLSSDGLPLIGRTPRDPEVFVATGHGMLGVTLAPATAALLAPLVLEGRADPVLRPFDPARSP